MRRLHFIYVIAFLAYSCTDNATKINQYNYEHPFDSINAVINYNSGLWKVKITDSLTLSGDSIMLYPNQSMATSESFSNGISNGIVKYFDQEGVWSAKVSHSPNVPNVGINVYYPKTGLSKYSFSYYDSFPVGQFKYFYNHYHDSIFKDGFIYPISTHLKEYRLYDVHGKLWYKRLLNENQSVKSDSGHSVIPIVRDSIRQVGKELTVVIWSAEPQGTIESLAIKNDQTNEIDSLISIAGESRFSFIPEEVGLYRFTIYHTLSDTLNKTTRRDSVTYRLHIKGD